ncbi:DUF6252 family protein [Hymenobacter baengnokdamensis]|uniref:DUF6252 family protein n=1 Tax=Hymenobacter baengnokdamensis TaxID=2615203 RepID=UPI001244C37D|nr:DUF6252 family protein [Hymenobacter baengnokdamensis]
MIRYRLQLSLLAALLGLSQCKKSSPDPEDQLPPATQTGANTFGCLVNGQPWTPQGYNGTSNYSVVYDSGVQNGLLDIQSYCYPTGINKPQSIAVISGHITKIGTYSLSSPQIATANYTDYNSSCYWSSRDSATTYRRGTLTITRLDLQAGIIAGTFAFTLYKPGCDSVRVTQGRFDKKL